MVISIGVSDSDFQQIASEFTAAILADSSHRLFCPPRSDEVVRLARKARRFASTKGWLSPDLATSVVEQWKASAWAQGASQCNAGKVVLSLFDHTGNWSRPWEEAGYHVVRFDIQDNPEIGDVSEFCAGFFNDLFADFSGTNVFAILAACPCTEFAVSGARHFAAKDADGRTASAVQLVHQTLRTIEYFRPPVWAIENPVGRIQRLTGLPQWRLSFDPYHFGDPYTKKTLIWGRFNADLPVAPVIPSEGSKMHRRFGGKSTSTKNARSVTPEGFAYGFFKANNALDNPQIALSGEFDRIDPKVFASALNVGVDASEIVDAISDHYYMDLDDDAAIAAVYAARAAMMRQSSTFR
jgi:hypothetical protein